MRDQAYLKALDQGCQELGIALSETQRSKLLIHAQQIWRWRTRVRLVGDDSPSELALRHSLDSLLVTLAVKEGELGKSALDLGSGAGFPGLVLAACWPDCQFRLIEADKRKASFLATCAGFMGLNTKVIPSRAEARVDPSGASRPAGEEGIGQASLVISRAVKPLAELLSWQSAYAETGGLVVAMLSEVQQQDAELLSSAAAAGLSFLSLWEGSLPGDLGYRAIGVWRKEG